MLQLSYKRIFSQHHACPPPPVPPRPLPQYDPNTVNINTDRSELEYWAGVLQDQIPTVVEKAITSEGSTKGERSGAAQRSPAPGGKGPLYETSGAGFRGGKCKTTAVIRFGVGRGPASRCWQPSLP